MPRIERHFVFFYWVKLFAVLFVTILRIVESLALPRSTMLVRAAYANKILLIIVAVAAYSPGQFLVSVSVSLSLCCFF